MIETHTIRNREKYDFDTYSGIYTRVSIAIEEVLAIIDEIFSGAPALLQLSRHINNKILINAIQVRKSHHFTPILGVLSQIASQEIVADEALLNKVLKIF